MSGGWPEFMYVEFPDGTTRRCKTTPDPEYGFPTTPGLNSPEWEIVTDDTLGDEYDEVVERPLHEHMGPES